MAISIFDLFSIGIGPSSSHTVGPMKAAYKFIQSMNQLADVYQIKIELFGSLALTGKGHGTDIAILNGLENKLPHLVDPDTVRSRAEAIIANQTLLVANQYPIPFIPEKHLIFHYQELLPLHTNGMRFSAYDKKEECIKQAIYYSIGGGFIITEDENKQVTSNIALLYPFKTAKELWQHCHNNQLKIKDVMLANELIWRSEEEIRTHLLQIADIMQNCIEKGCHTEGILPGGLNVKRRASPLYKKLQSKDLPKKTSFPELSLWPTVYAMAVNEENAAGGRIVTAPTNGAAGIIPAVLTCYRRFFESASEDGIIEFLLTAGAIAILYKTSASISGAEVGCQGEVGVACSMAAGALTAVLGGTLKQIENAAEMAMEHHLGMTCDPVAGLVQIPCIERNGVAAEKAIRLSQLALLETGEDKKISLDKVILTMLQTGKDMKSIYKETSLGGLAANIAGC
ncbi:MAG: L-serine dehydratase 2 [Legionellaceae bacterium]